MLGSSRTDEIRYSAFISYSHHDVDWARWLHDQLESYRLPDAVLGRSTSWGPLGRKLPPVFRDREELAASANLADSVRRALSASSSLIVICSKSSAQSRWVNQEVDEFVALGRRYRIQCLIIPEARGDPDNPQPESELFPPTLTQLGIEPLAADARKSGDGKRAALVKLIAGIIGVGYDELRQREQLRRQKRLLALASAATAGFVLMAGLAAFALVSRTQAVHERDVAREKTITAERTTNFVKGLFQVADPSEAQGEAISVREILDRGARQIQEELGNEPDVKAELISTLSEVYLGLGSYRRADDLIRRSLSIPVLRSETRARQLGVWAASSSLQGNHDQAEKIFDAGLRRLAPASGLSDTSLYTELLVGRAEALAELGRYDEARALISEAMAFDRTSEGEKSAEFARDLEALGLTDQLAEDYDRSNRSYLRALAIREAVQGGLHPKVSDNLNQLATNAYYQGNLAASQAYLRRVLIVDEKVIGPDHPNYAASLNNLGRLLLEERKFREALPLLSRSVKVYLAQRSDTHADLAFVFANRALSFKGMGKVAEAEADFRRALRAAETNDSRLIAPILTDLADLLCIHGKSAEALRMLARAAPIMQKRYEDAPWRSAWVENTKGACLLRQHDMSGVSLIRESAPAVLREWGPNSLYGLEVAQRLRSIS